MQHRVALRFQTEHAAILFERH